MRAQINMKSENISQHHETIQRVYRRIPASGYPIISVNSFRNLLKASGFLAPKLTSRLVKHLFFRPLKKPARAQSKAIFSELSQEGNFEFNQKAVRYYRWGKSQKKALLVHGWSGRATDFADIIAHLRKKGFEVLAFDAPAHGSSSGTQTNIEEFIALSMLFEKEFGPFHAVIGHSFGGLALINAAKRSLRCKKLVSLSAPTYLFGLVEKFSEALSLNQQQKILLTESIERQLDEESDVWDKLSAYSSPESLNQHQLLLVHCEDDQQIHPIEARCMVDALPSAELLLTQGLGHNKILGDQKIIEKVLDFLEKPLES